MAFKSSKWDFLISHLFFCSSYAMVTNQIRFLHSSSESHFGASSRPASDAGSSCLIHTAFIRGNLSGNVTYIELFGPYSSCHNYPNNYLRAEG